MFVATIADCGLFSVMAMTVAERQVRLLSFSVGAVITLGALLFIQLMLVRPLLSQCLRDIAFHLASTDSILTFLCDCF
jgi:hypothetical protein